MSPRSNVPQACPPSTTLMFFSSKQCPLCQRLSDDVRRVADRDHPPGKRPEVAVLQVDADDQVKWAPELLHYKVTNVPAFVLLDRKGQAVASTSQPRPYEQMRGILNALVSRAAQLPR
ncbi:hypothetical protein Agub_g13949 [Astrephomene gubernaculifera]|uniref:Thioredoxin domain-containing protein n=1 Tax=Astrephomene gubernaculifera TaxID=47775 RepID=A0AAD3HSS4_9CHLO|nr:hypothetical protein Agub_g13949 [Astrephomene gubernaculifera]